MIKSHFCIRYFGLGFALAAEQVQSLTAESSPSFGLEVLPTCDMSLSTWNAHPRPCGRLHPLPKGFKLPNSDNLHLFFHVSPSHAGPHHHTALAHLVKLTSKLLPPITSPPSSKSLFPLLPQSSATSQRPPQFSKCPPAPSCLQSL